MPMRERIQFTQALADRHGRRITDVADWRPLLRYSDGNPLAITVVVGQALREPATSRREIEAFVARLRAGEHAGRRRRGRGPIAVAGRLAELRLRRRFTEHDHARLALLDLFQDTVDVDALVAMGNPGAARRWPDSRPGEAGIGLLDRAAEIGLLTALGGGYYGSIRHCRGSSAGSTPPPPPPAAPRTTRTQAARVRAPAYTTAIAELGDTAITAGVHGGPGRGGGRAAEWRRRTCSTPDPWPGPPAGGPR